MRRILFAWLALALASVLTPACLAQTQTVVGASGPGGTISRLDLQTALGTKLDVTALVLAPTTYTVCASGCMFTDPVTAGYAAINARRIGSQIITVQIADGVYSEVNQFYTQNPIGGLVQFIGDTANPGAVVLNFTNVAGNNGGGFVANAGGQIGLIDGMTINAVGAQSANTGTGTQWIAQSYGSGIAASGGGSYITVGSHVAVNHFYYGIVADNNGSVIAPGGGVTATDSGDVNFMARGGGVIVCNGCHASRAADTTTGQVILGACFDAERGGSLYVDGSTCSGYRVGGIVGLTGGHIWAHTMTVGASLTGAGNGANIWEASSAELDGSIFSGATNNCVDVASGYASIANVSCTGATSDGIYVDLGGRISGNNVNSHNNGGYGLHASHGGIMELFATYSLLIGNTAGAVASDPAGTSQTTGGTTISGATYAASSVFLQ